MKKSWTFWIAAGFLFLTSFVQAQPEPIRDSIVLRVDGNRIIIRAGSIDGQDGLNLNARILDLIMQSKSVLQRVESDLKRLDMQLEAGTITEKEAEARRQEIAKRIEAHFKNLAEKLESIDDIELLEGDLEIADMNVEDDVEAWVDIWFDGDDSRLKMRSKNKTDAKQNKRKPNSLGGVELNWGLNTLVNADNTLLGGDDELKTWASNQFDFGFFGLAPLSKNRMLTLRSGINFSFHRFALAGSAAFQQSINQVSVEPLNLPVQRSTLYVNYINVPLLLQFNSRPEFLKGGFTLAAGGYAGLRTRTRNRIRFQDEANNQVDTRINGNYFINDFRYGLMAKAGYGNFNATLQYEINPFFRDDRGPEYYRISVTLGWDLM
jgi:hypothetical protein